MKLSDLGEFGLIEKLRDRLAASEAAKDVGGVVVGVGDDAAVTRTRSGATVVSTTDALVEGVHFRLDWSSAADVGFKSASVNVSDIAAMGAEPRWLLIALCAPADLAGDVIEGIYDGLTEAGALYGTQVVGGDTVRAPDGSDSLVVVVTALGELDGEPMLRSSAVPGDVLAVTGPLGRAAAGVNLLLSQDPKKVVPEHALACLEAHRRPVARVGEGRRLAAAGVRTAMDVSDGLASDARRLAEASGVAVELDAAMLPVAMEARSVAEDRGWDVRQMVLGGGEDLELLVAASSPLVDGLGLTAIGRVTDGESVWLVEAGGDRTELGPQGWDHFSRR